MVKNIIKDSYLYFVIIIILTFIILKIPHLFLPFYWDEAFGHMVAVMYMYNHKLVLLPSSIPPDISSGHPLMFHFCEAIWLKIFGTSQFAAKSFPMLLTVILFFSIYFFCKKFLNRLTGVVAVVLFASQEIIIAQSSFVLLEVMVTLMTILTLFFYFSKRRLLYIISATMLGLTKESGIVLPLMLIGITIFDFRYRNKIKSVLTEMAALITPLLLISVYFIIQKMTYGWYFYPLHIHYLTFTWKMFYIKLVDVYSSQIFIERGRNILTYLFVISIIVYMFGKVRPERFQKRVILVLVLFIISFLVFSSVNTLSNRYALCIYPIYIILCSYFILQAYRNYKLIAALILITILVVKLYHTYSDRNDLDSNLGFADATMVHQSVVKYCEDEHWQDKKIFTHFIMGVDLTNPIAGYLSDKKKIFNHITGNDAEIKDCDYLIFSSVEPNPHYDEYIKKYNLLLLKRFERYNSWSEIYQLGIKN